ncbi:IS1380 family transposase [Streptomyces sp. NPDC057910]|uniref:IS1380 family transposase n=1 Tax=Streptomyces sp. NPDC057910 TaxID=3346278 RepID=UPI0036E0F505
MKNIGWDERLSVKADGRGMVGHAGATLLRRCADRTGLTSALGRVLPYVSGSGWRERGQLVVMPAVAVVLGATSVLDAEALLAHQAGLFGVPASDSTMSRALAAIDDKVLMKIARARAGVRRQVWEQIAARPGGFPWLTVAGKVLTGWIVIDIDATIITSASKKQGAAATFKKTFGFHPLAAWCANTQESLAMLLREGSAGPNTVADHLTVLADALRQIPDSSRAKILIPIDGAGATHDLLKRLEALNTRRRTVRYLVGSAISDADEQAIALLPEQVWGDTLTQDGTPVSTAHVAELTGLNTRPGRPDGMRLPVRRTRPSARQAKNLTDLEKRTGWRYAITATNIRHMWAIPGSHQPQWLDALARARAQVEDRVRCNKAMGLHNLPSKDWTVNRAWMLTCNIAAGLDAWTRLLGLHDRPDLAGAEPATMRYRLYHLPAKLTRHARRRWLTLSRTWPWREAFTTCWHRLGALPAPT